MPLVAVPNVSEGRDPVVIAELASAVSSAGARTLDIHSDGLHHRSVLTATGDETELVEGIVALSLACLQIDLTAHEGLHPRLGALDVCPFVPHEMDMDHAVRAAHRAGAGIADKAGLPVFFYGDAALRPETRELPDMRRGGMSSLQARIDGGLRPDHGPSRLDPRHGVVCVGARGPLIAFNVRLAGDPRAAAEVARAVREAGRVRALAFELGDSGAQISMNLTAPDEVGIDHAFEKVAAEAQSRGLDVVATEIVGLVEARFMPNPDAKAARLLVEPGRDLDSVLT